MWGKIFVLIVAICECAAFNEEFMFPYGASEFDAAISEALRVNLPLPLPYSNGEKSDHILVSKHVYDTEEKLSSLLSLAWNEDHLKSVKSFMIGYNRFGKTVCLI